MCVCVCYVYKGMQSGSRYYNNPHAHTHTQEPWPHTQSPLVLPAFFLHVGKKNSDMQKKLAVETGNEATRTSQINIRYRT